MFLVSFHGLTFVLAFCLYLFVCASDGTYDCISLPLIATLHIFQELPQYCMKLTADTQLLNTLHSHQQHAAASVCHVTQWDISIHFVLPATAGHTATLQYAT